MPITSESFFVQEAQEDGSFYLFSCHLLRNRCAEIIKLRSPLVLILAAN